MLAKSPTHSIATSRSRTAPCRRSCESSKRRGPSATRRVERTFVFFPRIAEEKVRRGATHDLVERIFGGSPARLMSYLLENETVSKQELDEIRRLVDEQAQKPSRRKR